MADMVAEGGTSERTDFGDKRKLRNCLFTGKLLASLGVGAIPLAFLHAPAAVGFLAACLVGAVWQCIHAVALAVRRAGVQA